MRQLASNLFKFLMVIFAIPCAIILIIAVFAWGAIAFGESSIPLMLFLSIFILVAYFGFKFFGEKRQDSEIKENSARPKRLPDSDYGNQQSKTLYDGGVGAAIEIRETGITIKRSGLHGFFAHGLKGDKRIPYRSITAIQFKDASKHINGYIQFSIEGAIENSQGIWDATLDENTVMFTNDHSGRFIELQELIESQMTTNSTTAKETWASVADELAKLAELRDRQILNDQEFEQQKAAILRR